MVYGNRSTDTQKVYPLGIRHGTITGVTVPHTLMTDLKEGQSFKKGHILIYNKGFFERSLLNPSNVVHKGGVLARVAFYECADTNEDGNIISERLANNMLTPTTKLQAIVVDFDMVIHNVVKIGDAVTSETILCTLENDLGQTEDTRDAEAIQALNRIGRNAPKAGVYGKISNIEVLYFGEIGDMHPSLQEVVRKYDALRAKWVNQLKLPNGIKTGKIDETIRVANKKVIKNQAVIKIYIDNELAMGTGDKVVFGNQLKSTVSRVATDPMLDSTGQPVDAVYGYQYVAGRIVRSPEIMGTMNTILKALSVKMGQMYKK